MSFTESYRQQVRLLVRLLPLVAEESCFALKGGTAINLFVRNLPRLSVDIDLVYLPLHQRKEALAGIDAGMTQAPVSLADLEETRDALVRTLVQEMPEHHRSFLLGFEAGKPDWALIRTPEAIHLPAVRWRQLNLDKLGMKERENLVSSLQSIW